MLAMATVQIYCNLRKIASVLEQKELRFTLAPMSDTFAIQMCANCAPSYTPNSTSRATAGKPVS